MSDQQDNQTIQGDNVYGDKVGGDKVAGDKVTIGKVDHHHYPAKPRPNPESHLPLYQIPFPPNPHFTGRGELLTRLHANLSAGHNTVITQAIAGLGGVGKTQLALAYCYAYKSDYDLIAWLDANDTAALGLSLAELGYDLGVAQRAAGEQALAVQATLRWLERSERRWLLVYDNADQIDPGVLPAYQPKLGFGACLVTSRNPDWGRVTGATGILRLDVFTLAEAVAFLQVASGQSDPAAAQELAAELGRLPLALEHAAAYIAARHKTYRSYLALYQERRAELWKRAAPRHDYEKTIITTWELAFAAARATPGAADLLNLCCFLAPDAIPLAWLVADRSALPEELAACLGDELARDDALAALARYSLLTRDDGTLVIHRLVAAVGRDRMGAARRAVWSAVAIDLTVQIFPDDLATTYHTWTEAEQLLQHARAAADLSALEAEKWALLCNQIGFYLDVMGDTAGARPYFERALAISERVLGEEHPNTATSLNNMGALLQSMGDNAGARPYYERALVIYERVLGGDHPTTATSLNNMGYLLRAMGDNAGARPYYERALAIRERVLGSDHPDTANSLNNMGALLLAMGDTTGARPYYERALAIRERVLGGDHPATSQSLNNMGYLLLAMGDTTGARPYYERALAIRERVLGGDHPDTASSLNNMGALLDSMGDYAGARPYYERALTIYERVLGGDHPDTALSLNNMGYLLRAMGDYAGARPYYERALDIRERVLGGDHPNTATSLSNMGGLLRAMGEYAGARPYYERALAIYERVLGGDHPHTAGSLNNMGYLLQAMGDYAGARPYYERALAINEHVLGGDHPDTASSIWWMAVLAERDGDLVEARDQYKRTLRIYEKALGTEHPTTKNVRGFLISIEAKLK